MSNINLLPWREERKQKENRQFLAGSVLAGLMCAAASFGVKVYIDGLVADQQERNRFMQVQIAVVDQRLEELNAIRAKRKSLELRIGIIQDLQRSRNTPTELFNSMKDIVPAGIYVEQLRFAGKEINVSGKTESNNRISETLRNIDGSDWLGNGYLSSIVAAEKDPFNLSNFVMKFFIQPLQTEENKG